MWLYIPREYCPSSPESLDSISEFGLFFQNLELSVSLSGKATQRPYSWRGWQTRPWMKLLSGVTLQPSTAVSGMELWIQSLLASRAKTSQSQANKKESRKGHDQGCSLKPAELFAKYDQGIFLSKTSQDCFLTDSCPSYSENFPKWGSMHSGECFQQEMWEAPILEKESLSWATPNTMDHLPQRSPEALSKQANGVRKGRRRPGNLREQVDPEAVKIYEESSSWGTPTVDAISNRKNKYAQGGTPIAMQANSWPTPNTSDQHNPNMSDNHDVKKSYLRGVASSWPTPRMNDFKGHCTDATTRKDGKCRDDQLQNAVIYTGPSAPVKKNNGSDSSKSAPISPQPLKKRLNPKFVEHLMGMPPGWSLPIPIDQNDYKRWETESVLLLRLLHSASYGNE